MSQTAPEPRSGDHLLALAFIAADIDELRQAVQETALRAGTLGLDEAGARPVLAVLARWAEVVGAPGDEHDGNTPDRRCDTRPGPARPRHRPAPPETG
jgi:hypothetical protein